MHLSPVSLLAMVATLASSVVGTPVAAAEAVAPSQVPVPVVAGVEPKLILGTPGKAPISAEIVETRDLKITKRSYAGSCNSCSLNANYLQCKCRNAAQVEIWTSLDLNNCLANANGALVWRAGGGFYGSCSSQYRQLTGTVYGTICMTVTSAWVATTINLDDRIHNYNGVLGCAV